MKYEGGISTITDALGKALSDATARGNTYEAASDLYARLQLIGDKITNSPLDPAKYPQALAAFQTAHLDSYQLNSYKAGGITAMEHIQQFQQQLQGDRNKLLGSA